MKSRKNKRVQGVFGTKSVSDKVVFGVAYGFLALVALTQLFLLVWMIYSSLKDDIDMFMDIFAPPSPSNLHFENYSTVLSLIKVTIYNSDKGYVSYGLGTLFGNSILLAFLLPLGSQITVTVCAYILSKYRFVGRELLLKINFFVIIFPVVGSLASSLKVNYFLGRYDNLLLMIILGNHPFAGLGLLIQMSFYAAIPKEMMEAAEIDGAGHFAAFIRIHVPIIFPTILLYYVLAVFSSWNDYMTPLIWLPHLPNVALGMFQFQYDSAKYAASLTEVLAGFVMFSIPSILFYLLNQKQIMSRMVMTGLKG